MSLLPVEEALRRILADVKTTEAEMLPLGDAAGRVLAADLAARRSQPPFDASAMDGYAVRASDAPEGAKLKIIGTSRAGERFSGALGPGETVRIFTGAPVPAAADAIVIQENVEREGEAIRVNVASQAGYSIRRAGLDFAEGDVLMGAGRILDARAISLAAAMGHASLPVRRRPRVAILANGDELVPPGRDPGPDQIVSSNGVGLSAFVRECGGEAIDLGIAPDRAEVIGQSVDRAAGADILVPIGGASVGDHDLVQAALTAKGMTLDFWKIAMRPGKPLMVGRLRETTVLGLPGNPVSAFVCAIIFLKPLIRAKLGLPAGPVTDRARLSAAMAENDGRQDYVRARLSTRDGERVVTPFDIQDSSMLSTFAAADALIVRPMRAPAAAAGDVVPILSLRDQSAIV